mmetsp:Transcript_38515/g.119038  ORF Transcript_38515/g.119038 Transcript_38515/m.119038 type:complete len:200 (+) Transcript_38515:425-1024(+)
MEGRGGRRQTRAQGRVGIAEGVPYRRAAKAAEAAPPETTTALERLALAALHANLVRVLLRGARLPPVVRAAVLLRGPRRRRRHRPRERRAARGRPVRTRHAGQPGAVPSARGVPPRRAAVPPPHLHRARYADVRRDGRARRHRLLRHGQPQAHRPCGAGRRRPRRARRAARHRHRSRRHVPVPEEAAGERRARRQRRGQ